MMVKEKLRLERLINMDQKTILSIETSNELCSVALNFSENSYDERTIHIKRVHSERLIPSINELLLANNLTTKDITYIAVSIGPGSFTGLRIGLTAAKGIAFASQIPIVPVPTFGALSLEIGKYLTSGNKFCIVNNANIDECYFAKYKIENEKVIEITKPSLELKSELENLITQDYLIFGNLKGKEGIRFIGSPRATSIAKWAYLFGEDLLTFDYDYLEPNYLKDFKVKKAK